MRLVPAFVWPANIQWPDTAAQGTQAERTSLRRDYTQQSEAGTTKYVVTVSAAMSWDNVWTVADGKVETTSKTGWYNANLSKYEGDNLVDSLSQSGSLATGASSDTIHSLVVSVGTTGADLDLYNFSVDQPGATRFSFEDSYLGYTVGTYNTVPLSYHFAGGTSATTKIVTTQPSPIVLLSPPGSPPPPTGVFTTTTEQKFDTVYEASSKQWEASRKGRLEVNSGASSHYTSKLTNSPWLANGVEVGRNQVVDSKYSGNSWDKSYSYLQYGDSQSTEPNHTFGWVVTQHDETSESTGSYACDFNLVPGPTVEIDSGHANSKSETKTTVTLDKVESLNGFFLTLTDQSADPSTSEKTATGYTTSASTLTNGKSTVTTNGNVTYANRVAVCNDWSIWTAASAVQEGKSANLTKYREVWGNPIWSNPRGKKDLTIESSGVAWRRASGIKTLRRTRISSAAPRTPTPTGTTSSM